MSIEALTALMALTVNALYMSLTRINILVPLCPLKIIIDTVRLFRILNPG